MTQDELWLIKWQEAIDFLETNHRNPSKFVPKERNAGELKPERVSMFSQLLEIGEKYRHVNQYQKMCLTSILWNGVQGNIQMFQ